MTDRFGFIQYGLAVADKVSVCTVKDGCLGQLVKRTRHCAVIAYHFPMVRAFWAGHVLHQRVVVWVNINSEFVVDADRLAF